MLRSAALRGATVGGLLPSWWEWPAPLRDREPAALAAAARAHGGAIDRYRREQQRFMRQWRALRAHAQARGIALIGDVPIFVEDHVLREATPE